VAETTADAEDDLAAEDGDQSNLLDTDHDDYTFDVIQMHQFSLGVVLWCMGALLPVRGPAVECLI
jgi:hypothetical protein